MKQPRSSEFAPTYLKGLSVPDNASLAHRYACMTRGSQRMLRNRLRPGCTKLDFERWILESLPWRFFARQEQLSPPGDWQIWLFQAGRGAGKTRSGTEWIWGEACALPNQLCGVLSPTRDDLDKVTFDGPAGLLRIADRFPRLVKKVTKRPYFIELVNGSKLYSYTGEAYERLRGPQHHRFLMDEVAGMARVASAAFEQVMFGLRLKGPNGEHPRLMITSTPKPIPLFKRLNDRHAAGDKAVAVTRASTMDNRANLSELAIEELRASYENTRLGRQELMGELLLDVPGALWLAEFFQQASVPMRFDRIVVAVDPSGAADESSNSDEIGIVVVGVVRGRSRIEDRFYVLEDATMIGGPQAWARRAVRAFEDWEADRIVAEQNFGGAMVKATINNVDASVPVRLVTASRGKAVRAEPVSAVYEQGRAFHCGRFPKLEDQMMHMTTAGYVGEGSPDRLDAAVWGFSELMEGVEAPRVAPAGPESTSYWLPTP